MSMFDFILLIYLCHCPLHFKINFFLARTLDTLMSKGYCSQDNLRSRAGPGPGEHSHLQAAWHPGQEGHRSWQGSLVEKGGHLGKPGRDSRLLLHMLPDSCCPQLLVCQPCLEMSLSVCLSFQHCTSACREMPSLGSSAGVVWNGRTCRTQKICCVFSGRPCTLE